MSTRRIGLGWILLGLLVLATAVGVVMVLSDLQRVRQVWPPANTPEVSLPAPQFDVDAEAHALLLETLKLAEPLDDSALGDQLEAQRKPGATPASDATEHPEIQAALDRLLQRQGLQMPVLELDGELPNMLPALGLARLRLLRAHARLRSEDPDAASTDLRAVLRLGLWLEHGGGSLLSTMVGLSIQDESYDSLAAWIAAGQLRDDDALAALGAQLGEDLRRPSGIVAGMAAECLSGQKLLRRFRGLSTRQLLSATDSSARLDALPAEGQASGSSGSWFYNAERSEAYARWDCTRRLSWAGRPAGERGELEPVTLWDSERWSPGQLFDNPIGRIMLSVAAPNFGNLVQRADRILARRGLLVVGLALARFSVEHEGSAPASLKDLQPDYLAELPVNPWTTAPPRYDREKRQLTIPLPTQREGEQAELLSLSF